MIIERENQNVQNLPEFIAFCKLVSLKKALVNCCKFKSKGFIPFDIFQALFFTAFHLRNFWRLSASSHNPFPFARDTAYRFLNSCYHNWAAFLFKIALSAYSFIAPLTSGEKRKVFVVDDSAYNKDRSKKLELISRLYDHVGDCYYKGYRFLTLAFTDGVSLIPIAFSMLGGNKTLCPANPDIDQRSHGAKRRKEALLGAPTALLSMIDKARKIVCEGSYIVFDAWFSTPPLIRALVNRQLHVVGRLKNGNQYFLFRRNGKDTYCKLEQLFLKLKKIPRPVLERQQQREDILGSFQVALPADGDEPALPVKIVFLNNKDADSKQKWLAILTTDLEMSESDVVVMYAKRWKIEEFFKTTKSLLNLEREFQGRSYDMVIAHATLVCIRYIFLELSRRREIDDRTCGELFFHCCDEIPDMKLKEALILILDSLTNFLQNLSPSPQKCIEDFIRILPASLQRLLSNSCCVS